MKKILFLISCVIILTGCSVGIEQNYGIQSVVFPESRLDVIKIKGTILNDSLIKSIAVNRTGVNELYPAKNISIAVINDSLTTRIALANTAITPSSEQQWLKGALILPSACYQFQSTIVIPENKRNEVLPITLIKIELDKLDKSKVWVAQFKIESAQDLIVNPLTNTNYLKITFN